MSVRKPENQKVDHRHYTRSEVARMMNVSVSSVAKAAKILKESPALAKRVLQGEISLYKALKQLAELKSKAPMN